MANDDLDDAKIRAVYQQGQKLGKSLMLEEILKVLGLDKYIDDAIRNHERCYHDED